MVLFKNNDEVIFLLIMKKIKTQIKYYLKYLNPFSQALNQWLMPNDCYITCSGKVDGGGAQAHAIMSTMVFAEEMGLQYAHTPFVEIEHNSEDIKDWVCDWEVFLNLGLDEVSAKELIDSGIQKRPIRSLKSWKRKRKTLFEVPFSHEYTDCFPRSYLSLRKRLRMKYWATDKKSFDPRYNQEKISIAVHIRRGDVSNKVNSKRFTGNAEIVLKLKKILSGIGKSRELVEIRIYSQGDKADFQEFLELNASLHIDEDVFSTVHALVCADVLVMSKSSMSYIAGILSEGLVIYEPFWHQPLPQWLEVDHNKSIDARHFNRFSL